MSDQKKLDSAISTVKHLIMKEMVKGGFINARTIGLAALPAAKESQQLHLLRELTGRLFSSFDEPDAVAVVELIKSVTGIEIDLGLFLPARTHKVKAPKGGQVLTRHSLATPKELKARK
jgi:hypothetical protein